MDKHSWVYAWAHHLEPASGTLKCISVRTNAYQYAPPLCEDFLMKPRNLVTMCHLIHEKGETIPPVYNT
jgi:hypothetical protein